MSVSPGGVTTLAVRVILALLAAHAAVISIELVTGSEVVFGLIPLFDLDREQNVPTLVSTLLILANAAMCGLHWHLAHQRGRVERMWLVLAVLLTFVAVDEFASIHETIMNSIRKSVQATGIFYFVWVVPYLVIAGAVGLAAIPFLRRLTSPLRTGLVAAGLLYVAGAAGFEMLTGPIYEALPDKRAPLWLLLTTCEEILELAAMAICLRALTAALVDEHGPLRLNLQTSGANLGPGDEPYE